MEEKHLFGKCPYVTSQKVLTGKWSMYIMYLLKDGPVRFNELLRRMPESMTHATLSRQLKALEADGLVVRTAHSEIPPRVDYGLSEIGKKFERVLVALEWWGNEYIDYMRKDARGGVEAAKEEAGQSQRGSGRGCRSSS